MTDAPAILEVPRPPATEGEARLDFLQFVLGQAPQVDMPLKHLFPPGLYVREITMPAGAVVISRVHKFAHPFVISKGRLSVWSENDGIQHLAAPHTGITTPGTRRILFIHEETIWTTFHAGPWHEGMDPDEIVGTVTWTPDVSYMKGVLEQAHRDLETSLKQEIPA